MIKLNDIRNKLIEALKSSDLSQTDLAKALNVNQSMISDYLHGKKMPSLETFANLCEILDIDANEILCINCDSDIV